MAALFYAHGWPADIWLDALRGHAPSLDIRLWPDTGNVSEIKYALLWKPPLEIFENLPGLEVIFSLGAGVDHLLALDNLPRGVPVVRVVVDDLSCRMSEYAVLQVLTHHLRQREYNAQAARREWRELRQPAAGEVRVGVMGLGVLGLDAARKLAMMGFQVAGWSRSEKQIDGIKSYSGQRGLAGFLARTDILLCLLPLSDETRGILDYSLFCSLARDGAGGGPVLINAGRGGLQVEADIIRALDEGILAGASLDVFETEPLPQQSPLWANEKVIITPHCAAASSPDAISGRITEQIKAYEKGRKPKNIVDPGRGY